MKKTILFVAILFVGYMGFGQNNNSYIIKLKMHNDSVCFNTQNVSSIRIDAFGHELIYDDRIYWTALEDLDTVYVFRTDNTPDWVDLGLPSGLLWATRNVGASSPDDYGDYFAWGETSPKSYYSWGTYQYSCADNQHSLTKYCQRSDYGCNGYTDNLTILQPGDDAATANWGSGWRMPTKEEWQELYNNTTVTWTTQNGVIGMLFTATNGNSLFLPAAGYRWNDYLYGAGSAGNYWSSSFNTDYPSLAWYFSFNSGGNMYYYPRDYGRSVRAVRSSRQN